MGKGNKKINKNEFQKLEADLRILAESHRLAILHLLKTNGDLSVGQIADHLEISFKATSKHLLYLAKKDILRRRYDGPFVLYRVADNISEPARSIVSIL